MNNLIVSDVNDDEISGLLNKLKDERKKVSELNKRIVELEEMNKNLLNELIGEQK